MFIFLKNIFSEKFNKKTLLYYYSIFFLLICWAITSFILFITSGFYNFFNGFVIFSHIIKVLIIFFSLYFVKLFFVDKDNSKKTFNYFKIFTGYGIVISYVFFSFPRIVGEFYRNVSFYYSVVNYSIVLFSTLFPAILYFIISLDQTRLFFNFFTKEELDYEKKLKKDKNLKKKEQEKIKKSRTFLAYIWYEWIDVILQAIIIAMLIQQFFFQMYQIPSESMVPTFLIRDRVVVNKMIYGPHIPLTEWKLPSIFEPKNGDIVVFINPKTDDEKSEIRYNSIFSRVFHPFIYMLTLSMVDIDRKKSDGTPKERFLVKRLIAKKGEKICMVNDIVYKKSEVSKKWIAMKDINGEKEYGNVELYYKNISNLQSQVMPEQIRKLYVEADKLIDSYTIEELKKELVNQKSIFISKSSLISTNLSNFINSFNDKRFSDYKSVDDFITKNLANKIAFVSYYKQSSFKYYSSDLKKVEEELATLISQYNYSILLKSINDLIKIAIEKKLSFDNLKNIYTDLNIKTDDSPYTLYMKKVNALFKIYTLKVYSKIIDAYLSGQLFKILDKIDFETTDFYKDFKGYYLLNIYLYGIPYYNNIIDSNFFSLRNLYDFPEEEDKYIENNEFFLMGDNRYNSLDSRFDSEDYSIKSVKLDKDDNGPFSCSVKVRWKPHTVNLKYILGKAKIIYWPINRATIFK